MIDRPRIGCLADHDMKLWRFERSSGLPRGYFDRPRLSADAFVVWLCIVGFIVGLWVAA